MSSFERINSGIPGVDQSFDNLRLGDNIIVRVTDLNEFRGFIAPIVNQAIEDGRKVIYIRFADHAALLKEDENIEIIPIEKSKRFERFTVTLHNIVNEHGKGVLYVFDCLSELQTAWATDLMMGNFFTLTCPLLHEMDAVAFWPIRRAQHSFHVIAKMREKAQLFLDIFSSRGSTYVRPLKVWNRDTETMFLPHLYDPQTRAFDPITGGVQASRFYRSVNKELNDKSELSLDSWDRFFQQSELLYQNGIDIKEATTRMCHIMLTRDPKMRVLIEENFTPDDYFEIRNRMIGSGLIGGKACGMLLARKLIENNEPDIWDRFEPHDSFYVGSDVFYSYLVENDLWDLHIRQTSDEGYFTLAKEMKIALANGKFTKDMEEQFKRVLDYYGNDPCIVRSSSILEDGFGNAFAGKYESVFCSNNGTEEERLEEFENAIRTVYKSTMSLAALDYRKRRGLDKKEEQMSLLVQRVSGSRFGKYFLPSAAGVGYSVSPYKFGSGEGSNGGMLRLVAGLGTAAVDREQGSYPRLVSCNDPTKSIATSVKERHQYSQQVIDAVNTETGAIDPLGITWADKNFQEYQKRMLLSHDYDAESMFLNRGQRRNVYYVSCEGIVKNKELMDDMKTILEVIQEEYEYPVDIEYTINLSEYGEYVIDLLQCRPLQVSKNQENVEVPTDVPEEKIFLESKNASMGLTRKRKLDYIVYVDAMNYYQMPYKDKYNVRNAIRSINWAFRGEGKMLMLLTPGRICTSSPELGVPTTFADISEFDMIAEVSEVRAGYLPELSYGSHIFQDLVEADILYTAIFSDEKTKAFHPEKLEQFPNKLLDFAPDAQDLLDIVRVCDVSESDCTAYYDFLTEHFLMTF